MKHFKAVLYVAIFILVVFGHDIYSTYYNNTPPPRTDIKKWTFPVEQELKKLSIKRYAESWWNDSTKKAFGNEVIKTLKERFPNGYPTKDQDDPLLFPEWENVCWFKQSIINMELEDSLSTQFNRIVL